MSYFISPANELYWLDDDKRTDTLPNGSVLATAQQVQDIQNPLPTLAEAKTQQLALIDASYAAAVTAPIAYMGTTFQADQASQDLIASVITASGGALPTGFAWYDVNNAAVVMTYADLQGLAEAILSRGQPLFVHKQAQKSAIRAATTVSAVQAITW